MKTLTPYFLLISLLISFGMQAQEVQFQVKLSQKTIGLNENLRVEFSINQSADYFKAPNFDGFRVRGPIQSVKRIVINGQESIKRTYTYILIPEAKGKFTIGPGTIKIDGEVYKTTQQEVTVKGSVDQSGDNANNQNQISQKIELVTEVSNRQPYLNEGIAVKFKLYIKPDVNISNPRILDMPNFNKFWSQVIPIKRLHLQKGRYNGQIYDYVVLKKAILYPQTTGKLKIEPFTISLDVRVPTNRRNIFGRPVYDRERKNFASETRVIDVQPLPSQGKPANFTGAVGDFNFDVNVSKRQLKTSESLEARVEISGEGNLKLLSIPRLKTPQGLETYEPEYKESVNTNLSGMRGSVTEVYTLVPNHQGTYELTPIAFSYFDPDKEAYVTLTSDTKRIEVESLTQNNSRAPSQKNDSSQVVRVPKNVVDGGEQFRFIKVDTDLRPIHQSEFFNTKAFWWLLLAPFLVFPLGFFIKNKKQSSSGRSQKQSKRAKKLVKKHLSEAKKNLGNQQAFYNALERSLYNYIKAKFDIKTGEISKQRTAELLREKNVDPEKIDQFNDLLKSCEFARYTPSSDVQMKRDYTLAGELITKIDKELKQ